MDMVGTGLCSSYWRGLLVYVVDPRFLVQFYGPGFCPRLLAWVLGLGSSLLTHVTGLDCWPMLLAHSFGTVCWPRFFAWGSYPRLLTYVNGESPRFLVQFLGPGYSRFLLLALFQWILLAHVVGPGLWPRLLA